MKIQTTVELAKISLEVTGNYLPSLPGTEYGALDGSEPPEAASFALESVKCGGEEFMSNLTEWELDIIAEKVIALMEEQAHGHYDA